VLLRHTPVSGAPHIDWLIAPRPVSDPGARELVTWRLDEAVALLFAGTAAFAFDGVRLPDHRVRYLEYEGEIGAGRGRVDRVRRGEVRILACTAVRVELALRLVRDWRIEGERIGAAPNPRDDGPPPLGLWRFRARASQGLGG
jgi:hypothetical protein